MSSDPAFGAPDGQSMLETALREPAQYRVLLHNDNYTTMEFVVEILATIFRKTTAEATAIMLAVHEKGQGECGVYPMEIAETKVALVRGKARTAGYPLRCSLEEL